MPWWIFQTHGYKGDRLLWFCRGFNTTILMHKFTQWVKQFLKICKMTCYLWRLHWRHPSTGFPRAVNLDFYAPAGQKCYTSCKLADTYKTFNTETAQTVYTLKQPSLTSKQLTWIYMFREKVILAQHHIKQRTVTRSKNLTDTYMQLFYLNFLSLPQAHLYRSTDWHFLTSRVAILSDSQWTSII